MLMPDWVVPKAIKAVCFDKTDTATDMARILPNTPVFLNQVHGNRVVTLPLKHSVDADGSYSKTLKQICAIKTADCLAIYLASTRSPEIALLHGGWRGLSQHIITRGLEQFTCPPSDIVAFLGPAISSPYYEIGMEVYDAFCLNTPALAALAFQASRPFHYYCDLYAIARYQLQQKGVTAIYGGDHCTFSNDARFHSYRRDKQQAGRLLHCLWIDTST